MYLRYVGTYLGGREGAQHSKTYIYTYGRYLPIYLTYLSHTHPLSPLAPCPHPRVVTDQLLQNREKKNHDCRRRRVKLTHYLHSFTDRHLQVSKLFYLTCPYPCSSSSKNKL